SQTLQQVFEPESLIQDLVRIGHQVIVSFPNFSHWNIRLQSLFKGVAPVSPQLPYAWYNTPNIRTVTIKDFKKFIRDFKFKVVREAAINTHSEDFSGRIIYLLPNLRATYGIFMIEKIDQ
ncbi:MAG: methionine biosynthesis protein MetW, partial [Thermodesulfobacteriota bacterium]